VNEETLVHWGGRGGLLLQIKKNFLEISGPVQAWTGFKKSVKGKAVFVHSRKAYTEGRFIVRSF
jgi:hypothetical protein